MKTDLNDLMTQMISATISSMITRPEITILSNSSTIPMSEDLTVTQTFSGERSGWIKLTMELFTGINLAEASLRNIHIDELEEGVFVCLSRISCGIAQELSHADFFADQNLQFNPPCFNPASHKRLAEADKVSLDVLIQDIGQLRLSIGLKPVTLPPVLNNNVFACSGF